MSPRLRFARAAAGSLLVLAALAAGLVPAWRGAFRSALADGRLTAWTNPRPERFQISWRTLESPFPARFEATGLRLAGRTARLQWELAADAATADLAPAALLRRELAFRRLHAHGVALRIAHYPGQPGAGAAEHAATIAGFPAGPAPAVTPRGRPWSFTFRDLVVEDWRELWIDDRRWRGRARARGGFDLRRRAQAEVRATELTVAAAELEAAGLRVARNVSGDLRFRVRPWRYPGAQLADLLPRFAGRARLSGRIDSAAFVGYLFGGWPWLETERAESAFETAVEIDRARFQPGSRLRVTSGRRTVGAFGLEAVGDAELSARVRGAWRGPSRLESELHLQRWTLGYPEAEPTFVGTDLRLGARGREPRVDRAPEAVELVLDLGQASAPDLRFLNALLPGAAGVAVTRGSATATGQLTFTGGRSATGRIRLLAPGLALTARELRLVGDLEADFALSQPQLQPPAFGIDGSRFALSGASTATGAGRRRWWGEVTVPSGRLTLGAAPAAHGRFAARLADTRPVVALYELRRDLPEWAERLLVLEGVSARGGFDWRPGRLDLLDVALPLQHGELRGTLRLEREPRGRLLASWRDLAVGLELGPDGRRLRLRDARAWYLGAGAAPASP